MSNESKQLPKGKMLPKAMLTVLECLGDGKEHYPYGIVLLSNGGIRLGSIYVLLGRLSDLDLVTFRKESQEEQGKRRIPRSYYKLTKRGAEILGAHQAAKEAYNNVMSKTDNEL